MQINKENIKKLEQLGFEKKKNFFHNIISSNKVDMEKKRAMIHTIQKNSDDKEIQRLCEYVLGRIESGLKQNSDSQLKTKENILDKASRERIKSEIKNIVRDKSITNMKKLQAIRKYVDKYDDGELQYILRYAYHGIKKRISLQKKTRLKDIASILGGDDSDMKIEVLKELQKNQTDQYNELILNTLKHEKDPFVIATLISTYGMTGESSKASIFREYLQHPDPRIRANTVECLTNLKNPKLYRDVMMMIEDTDPRVKANVATLLSREGKYKMLEIIKAMVYSGKENQLKSAAFVLDKLKKDENATRLLSIAQMKLKKIERDSVFDEIKKGISEALENERTEEEKNLSEKVSSGFRKFFGKK